MQFFRNISGGGEPPPSRRRHSAPTVAAAQRSADDSLLARAVAIIEVATQHDNRKEYAAALREYERGTQILLDALKQMPDGDRKAALRLKAIEYIERAEALKRALAPPAQRGAAAGGRGATGGRGGATGGRGRRRRRRRGTGGAEARRCARSSTARS